MYKKREKASYLNDNPVIEEGIFSFLKNYAKMSVPLGNLRLLCNIMIEQGIHTSPGFHSKTHKYRETIKNDNNISNHNLKQM